MKYLFFICILGFPFSPLWSQLSDDFSDGNITSLPVWYGDTQDFIVNDSLQLQLNAKSGGNSILCTSLNIPDAIRWEIAVSLQFAPSSTNKLRIYLMLDTIELNVASGYYVEIGQNGSLDPIHFFSLENGEEFLLGSSRLTFDEEVNLYLTVVRASNGTWTFYVDNGDGFVNEVLRLNDATFRPSHNRSFCLECYYTSTRHDKFLFDDIRVENYTPDITPPELMEVNAIDSSNIELIFNENIGPDVGVDQIYIEPGIGNPSSTLILNHKIQLKNEKELRSGTTYVCTVRSIPDTAKNTSSAQEITFEYIKISTPLPGDLAINEILFDPNSDDSPFIEIYNASGKYFNCSDIILSIEKNNAFSLFSNMSDHLIFPDSFIVFTNDRMSTISNYPSNNISVILEADLPGLSRNYGSIVLHTRSGRVIDSVYYDEGFHHILIDEPRGVSLERISPTSPALSRSDWNSASAQSGWGTPGLRNSQHIQFDSITTMFQIENQFFTPDGDGHQDFLLIRFADEAAGQLATARVFDEFGREVSILLRNELLGSGSTGKWDGTIDSQAIAPTGIYILLIELMDERGIVNAHKEALTLATGI